MDTNNTATLAAGIHISEIKGAVDLLLQSGEVGTFTVPEVHLPGLLEEIRTNLSNAVAPQSEDAATYITPVAILEECRKALKYYKVLQDSAQSADSKLFQYLANGRKRK